MAMIPAGILISLLSCGATAQGAAAIVDVRGRSLGDALAELARENGVDILYTADLVQGHQSQAIKGRLSGEQALARLLAGSGIDYRLTPDGVFVLFATPTRVVDSGDGAISEVLVIGRRTQNTDIRRTENDIQPYNVIGPRELAVAPHDDLGQYFRDRLSANGQLVSPYQDVRAGASNNSSLDLHGLGSQRTLVLVDGRRLPALPTQSYGFSQSDLNAIPLGAIERIESLTGTIGGVHGPSAIGGVVNVVLKRDYSGAEVALESGVSSRGDAGHFRVEGRAGFTPNDGRTHVLIAGSYAAAERFAVGQRDYALRSKQYRNVNDPKRFYLGGQPIGGVLIGSIFGDALKFTPSLGGASLGSVFTHLPLDFQGDRATLATTLAGNAGRQLDTPAEGLGGEDTSLVSTPRTRSILFNARHRASDRVEAFIDALYLDNRAEARLPRYFQGTLGASPLNPFTNALNILVPLPDLVQDRISRTSAYRVTAGGIVRLPGHWQASADYTVGRAALKTQSQSRDVGSDYLGWGVVGRNGQPALTPFGDYATLQAGLRSYLVNTSSRLRLTNRLYDATVRAAGPVLSLPGGPLTLTLMGEFRREHIPEAESMAQSTFGKSSTLTYDRAQDVRTGYAELRAPLVPTDARFIPIRGLELQLAGRRDDVRMTVPDNRAVAARATRPFTARRRADVYTVGARVLPRSWLMLRASLATGQTPPALQYLQERTVPVFSNLLDPQRGNRPAISEGAVIEIREGSHRIRAEEGRTISGGLVLNPTGGGPRLSIDVSRIEIRDEIVKFTGSNLFGQGSPYSERVDREPLTDADAVLGFTAGRITAFYTGYGNDGRTTAQTVDYDLDWTLPATAHGQGRLYGAATWQPVLKSKVKKDGPWLGRAGLRDAPPRWKGNAGLTWTRDKLTVDLNVQYVGGARTLWSPVYPAIGDVALAQGSNRLKSQTYIDLTARRRFTPPANSPIQAFDVRLGVQNLFDTSPPIIADVTQMGYDYHGDPRRRRFGLLLAARF